MVSARPSAVALSFRLAASFWRHWLFWSRATKRNVMMVVTVLMTSCHVSMVLNSGRLGAQITTSNTQNTKNHALLTNRAAASANLSKKFIVASFPDRGRGRPHFGTAPLLGWLYPKFDRRKQGPDLNGDLQTHGRG